MPVWVVAASSPHPGLPPKAERRKTKFGGTNLNLDPNSHYKTQPFATMAQTQARHREAEGGGDPWTIKPIRASFTSGVKPPAPVPGLPT